MSNLRHWVADRTPLLLFFVLCLNVLDAFLTRAGMDLGGIEEANPLMAYLLELGPGIFVVVKLSLVTLGCILLWRYRYRRTAQWSMLLVLAVYSWVMVKHWEVWQLLEVYGPPVSPTL